MLLLVQLAKSFLAQRCSVTLHTVLGRRSCQKPTAKHAFRELTFTEFWALGTNVPVTFLNSLHRLIHTIFTPALLQGYCSIHPSLRWRNWSRETLRNLLKVTQLGAIPYQSSELLATTSLLLTAHTPFLLTGVSGIPADPLSSSCLPHRTGGPRKHTPSLHCLITSSSFPLPPRLRVSSFPLPYFS